MSSPSSDKPDLGPPLLASTISLTVLGALFVLIRLWVRFLHTKAHGWDDYFISVSLASSIVSMSLTVAMVANGYGKTVEVIEPSHMTRSLKYSNFAVLINGFSMAFLKVSIGLSILRLQLGKSMYWIVVGSIVLSVVCNALVVVSTLFGCRPLEAVWNRQLLLAGEASCLPRIVNMSNSYVQTGGANIVTDLFYSLGPLYYLSKVKVSVYNRWALRGVFLIGLLATICAIAKCFELPKLRLTRDPTFDGTRLTIWVRAELNAGLIAAAIPPLKAVFEQILSKVFGVQSGLRSNTSYRMHSNIKRSGAGGSWLRHPDDDEIAIRSHAAIVQGSAYPHQGDRRGVDIESTDYEDQNGGNSINDRGSDSRDARDGITKTVAYVVQDYESDDRMRQ